MNVNSYSYELYTPCPLPLNPYPPRPPIYLLFFDLIFGHDSKAPDYHCYRVARHVSLQEKGSIHCHSASCNASCSYVLLFKRPVAKPERSLFHPQ